MSQVHYKATGKFTPDGQEIYHRLNGSKGRPALFIKVGDRYKAWKRPVAKKGDEAAAPSTPDAAPSTPATVES